MENTVMKEEVIKAKDPLFGSPRRNKEMLFWTKKTGALRGGAESL